MKRQFESKFLHDALTIKYNLDMLIDFDVSKLPKSEF